MYKLCVFGGTTEGRELVEFLNTQPCRVTACVATEYGQTLLPEGENLTVSARPLPVGEIGALLQAERFDLVIDATHPYAASITRSIAAACEAAGVEHWRLLRGASEAPEDAVFAENTDEAVRFLSGTEGNILLTTGSKELSKFAALPDFAARCWARVLPLPASLEACSAAGLSPSHIFALQGPFSREMDEAMLHRTGARWLVTKDGGAAGGEDDGMVDDGMLDNDDGMVDDGMTQDENGMVDNTMDGAEYSGEEDTTNVIGGADNGKAEPADTQEAGSADDGEVQP